ncbi:MAG TPA: diguanylate cyclase [Geothrix sp.]|nr:diguanylate cyclase [Geothrix sp.]
MSRSVPRLARLLWLLCLFTTLVVPAGIPSSGRMVFRALGPAEGLEHTSLTTLTQDSAGFLWVGTEGGAYRYDGTGFRLWSLREGLPSAWVRAFAATPDGGLWIGTRAGLCLLREGRVRRLEASDPLASARIHQIALDLKGRLWVAAETGLFWSVGQGRRFAPVPGWPAAEPAFTVVRGAKGMWAGGPAAVRRRLEDGSWQAWGPAEGVPAEPVKALLESGQGVLWLRTPSSLRTLAPEAPRFSLPATGLPSLLISFYEESLRPDGAGGLFVPTAKGLLHFPAGSPGRTAWRLLDESRGIPSGWVNQALVDGSGNLWVTNLGLHRLQGTGDWENFTQRDGLPADSTWGLLRDRKGVLWASTSGGLATMDGARLKPFAPSAGLVLYTMRESPDGAIWGGGEHAFLVRISPDRARITRIPMPTAPSLAIPVALTFGPDGSLWIATANDGLWQAKNLDGRPVFSRAELPGSGELGQITALHLDGRGRLWAATGRGLACLTDGVWRTWGAEIGLHAAPLWALVPMADGTAWVAYLEPFGLTQLDLQGDVPKVLRHRTRKEGLASDSVYSLVRDGADQLWVGGPRGVQRWTGEVQRLFRREDGLAGTDCNPFSTWVDADNSVWFGTTAGILHHRPSSPGRVSRPPEAMVTSFRLGSRSWDLPLLGPADLGQVPYGDHTLIANVTSLAFEHEGRLRFQARLVGLEEDWVDLQGRELRYPALPSGPYTLEVRTRVEEGPTGPATRVRFQILPPWWNRWWARGLWAALGALAVLMGFRWRVRRLRRRNEELKTLVYQRTEALELSNLALTTISTTDPLTGLRNRRYLEEQLPPVVALVLRVQHDRGGPPAHDACLVFAMLDIDHFKRVNDTWSHAAGDLALKQIAEVLKREARESDFLIRWGGEEILFVGHTTDLDGAAAAVARLHQAVRQHPFDLGLPSPVSLTCSIGFSLFPFHPDHPEAARWEDQVRVADRCLYAAKRSGRDGWAGVAARPGAPPDLAVAFDRDPAALVQAEAVELRTSPRTQPLDWD